MYYDYDGQQLLLPTLLPDLKTYDPPNKYLPREPTTWLRELVVLVPKDAKTRQHFEPIIARAPKFYRCRTVDMYWDEIQTKGIFNDDQLQLYRATMGKLMVSWPPGMYHFTEVLRDQIDEFLDHANASTFKMDRDQDMNKVVDIMHRFYDLRDREPNWASRFINECEGDANGDGGYFRTVLNRKLLVFRNLLHMQEGRCTIEKKAWAYYNCSRQHVDAHVKTLNRQALDNNVYPTSFRTQIQKMTKQELVVPTNAALLREEVRHNPLMFSAELTAYLIAQWKEKGVYTKTPFPTYEDRRTTHMCQPPELYG